MIQNLIFSPNRIFAAIIDNEADAFLRFAEINDALDIWIRKYQSEMREAPDAGVQEAKNTKEMLRQLRKEVEITPNY